MKRFLPYLKTGLILLMVCVVLSSCDKNRNEEDEPDTNPKNIIGKWQKYQVLNEDNIWVSGDPDEYWIFKSDGNFQNEDGGEITTVGTYQINGSVLTIYSHSVDNPNELENFSGEFYFKDGNMYYNFLDLETKEESFILFKKM